MRVEFGAYAYVLRVSGDVVTGTMLSPVDTLEVTVGERYRIHAIDLAGSGAR